MATNAKKLAELLTSTGFSSTGIDDNADANAITIDSSENVKLPSDAGDFTLSTNSLHIGAGGDIKIGHTNNNNCILSDNSMPFTIFTDIFRCNSADNTESLFGADKNGAFFAKHDDTTMFQTNANGISMAANKGIDFSASTDSSAVGISFTNEVLSDNEEGEWTPGFHNLGTAGSTVTAADYTRIGRTVHLFFNVTIVANTDDDPVQITGLPFDGDTNKIQTQPYPFNNIDGGYDGFTMYVQGTSLFFTAGNQFSVDRTYRNFSTHYIRGNVSYQII